MAFFRVATGQFMASYLIYVCAVHCPIPSWEEKDLRGWGNLLS
jgi:hypothetical protein